MNFRKLISLTPLLAPFVIFSIPMGIRNNAILALGGLSCIAFLIVAIKGKPLQISSILIYFVTTSIFKAIGSHEMSWFQMLRTGIPFFCLVTLLLGFEKVVTYIRKKLPQTTRQGRKMINFIITLLVFGQALQVFLFLLNIPLANVMFGNTNEGAALGASRIFLFPLLAGLLIYFNLLIGNKIFYIAMMVFSLFMTGSKAVLATMMVLAGLVVLKKKNFKTAFKYFIAMLVVGASALLVNPLAVERLASFITVEKGQDITRQAEILHAEKAFTASAYTIVFGNGFLVPITPGVSTNDPRWFENSKFDIENAYWMLLAKVGLFGTFLFCMLFFNLPKNIFTAAAILIMAISSFGGGSPFFGFDGCYLILWLALLESKNRGATLLKKSPINLSVGGEQTPVTGDGTLLKGSRGTGMK